MTMASPPHPGRSLLRDCIEELGLTIAEAAERLRIQELISRGGLPLRGPNHPHDRDSHRPGVRRRGGDLAGDAVGVRPVGGSGAVGGVRGVRGNGLTVGTVAAARPYKYPCARFST